MALGVFGDGRIWKEDLFPDELIPDILELIIASWKILKKPNRLDREVPISKAFTRVIRAEKNQRHDLPFHVWWELPTLNTKAESGEDGRIDILFAYIGTPREDISFAFECKRLRIPYPNGLDTNNSDYVGDQGIMCFVTGKYGRSVANAGMIAYVMDGRTNIAIESVGKLIEKKCDELRLVEQTGLDPSSMITNHPDARETRHILSDSKFTIHHLFLAV